MAIFDPNAPRPKIKRPAPFGDGEFTLIFRRPTFEEQANDIESTSGYVEARLALLEGWEGLNDPNQKPIPFSSKTFKQMCEIDPRLLIAASSHAAELFISGVPDEETAKNAIVASEDSLEADETEPQPTASAEQ